jgi:hypothetical protein
MKASHFGAGACRILPDDVLKISILPTSHTIIEASREDYPEMDDARSMRQPRGPSFREQLMWMTIFFDAGREMTEWESVSELLARCLS